MWNVENQLTAEATPANPKNGAYGGQVVILDEERVGGVVSGRVRNPQPAVAREAWITGLGSRQMRPASAWLKTTQWEVFCAGSTTKYLGSPKPDTVESHHHQQRL